MLCVTMFFREVLQVSLATMGSSLVYEYNQNVCLLYFIVLFYSCSQSCYCYNIYIVTYMTNMWTISHVDYKSCGL